MFKLKQNQADKYSYDIYFGKTIIGTTSKTTVATLEILEMEDAVSFDISKIEKMPVKDFPENFFFMTETKTYYATFFNEVSLFRQKNDFSIELCGILDEETPALQKSFLWNHTLFANLVGKIAAKKKPAAATVKYKISRDTDYMQFTFYFDSEAGDTIGKLLQQAVAHIEQIFAEASETMFQMAIAESKKRGKN